MVKGSMQQTQYSRCSFDRFTSRYISNIVIYMFKMGMLSRAWSELHYYFNI